MSALTQAALWGVVAALPLLIGAAIASRFDASARAVGLISATRTFAAGSLLTMVTVDLIPGGDENGGAAAGLAAVLGCVVAFALH